jgi:hypothetical protein
VHHLHAIHTYEINGTASKCDQAHQQRGNISMKIGGVVATMMTTKTTRGGGWRGCRGGRPRVGRWRAATWTLPEPSPHLIKGFDRPWEESTAWTLPPKLIWRGDGVHTGSSLPVWPRGSHSLRGLLPSFSRHPWRALMAHGTWCPSRLTPFGPFQNIRQSS